MSYDNFVLPFSIGLLFLIIIVFYKFISWINKFSDTDKKTIKGGFFSTKSIEAIKEIILESLFHRRIFRVNPVLGYMHCTFALGWFLLIVIGNIESRIHAGTQINLPYYPIFFKFFEHRSQFLLRDSSTKFFTFTMDFVLLFILSGVLIAMSKRFYTRLTGMKKTTKMKLFDRLALTTLWCIFPLRLIAESSTSGIYHTGNFLTDSLGGVFGATFSGIITYPAWWAYSTSLGLFFISVPFSRYMHIPTEILFIALKKYGITQKSEYYSFSEIAVNSCPRCGICIDVCQLSTSADVNNIQSVYVLRSIRDKDLKEDILNNCLLCGRCQEFCPVRIDLNNIRIAKRNEFVKNYDIVSFSYLNSGEFPKADYIYFAGCMSHLTPTIKLSMISIFKKAKINYMFMDEDASICCGKPLKMAGFINKANELAEKNKKIIDDSGAKILITSCPICYRIFREDYKLKINVLHHSEFLLSLVNEHKIQLNTSANNYVYHDPCELGRGSEIYEQPRDLINKFASLVVSKNQMTDSLCCGGCLGDLNISESNRKLITADVINGLTINALEAIITACPLCKKTLTKDSAIDVFDISELVNNSVMVQ
jgi:Fe-S oxidoreductase